MKQTSIGYVQKKVTLSIIIVFLVLFILVVGLLQVLHTQHQQEKENIYNEQVHLGVKHIITHYIKEYSYHTRYIIENKAIDAFLSADNKKDKLEQKLRV